MSAIDYSALGSKINAEAASFVGFPDDIDPNLEHLRSAADLLTRWQGWWQGDQSASFTVNRQHLAALEYAATFCKNDDELSSLKRPLGLIVSQIRKAGHATMGSNETKESGAILTGLPDDHPGILALTNRVHWLEEEKERQEESSAEIRFELSSFRGAKTWLQVEGPSIESGQYQVRRDRTDLLYCSAALKIFREVETALTAEIKSMMYPSKGKGKSSDIASLQAHQGALHELIVSFATLEETIATSPEIIDNEAIIRAGGGAKISEMEKYLKCLNCIQSTQDWIESYASDLCAGDLSEAFENGDSRLIKDCSDPIQDTIDLVSAHRVILEKHDIADSRDLLLLNTLVSMRLNQAAAIIVAKSTLKPTELTHNFRRGRSTSEESVLDTAKKPKV